MPLELHCHTLFSVDGRCTPEELVDVAADRGITTLALTDHNSLDGLARAGRRAGERGIRFLTGVELDAIWQGRGLHFVAVGFNADDRALSELAARSFSIYEHTFGLLLEHFAELGHPGLEAELRERLPNRYPTHPSPVLNQWFARDVLLEEGLFPDREAFGALISEAKKRVEADLGPKVFRGFPNLDEVLPTVHRAGGILVLAHVAYHYPGDEAVQLSLARDLVEFGLDGFELYHPSNLAEPHFNRLVALADELGCVATGGSDCHDCSQNGKNPVGCSNTPDNLLDRIDEALSSRHTGSKP